MLGSVLGEMLDTSPEERRRYYALLRRMSPADRARVLVSLCRRSRQMAEAGIRAMHPGLDGQELSARLTARLYGTSVARRLHGRIPEGSG
jgi:hypothetical protein